VLSGDMPGDRGRSAAGRARAAALPESRQLPAHGVRSRDGRGKIGLFSPGIALANRRSNAAQCL
jgi:hypothetical protein